MKFLSFEHGGYERVGWLQDDNQTVLSPDRESRGMPQTVMDVIKRGPYARHQIKTAGDKLESFNLDDVQLNPPIIPWATFVVSANSSEAAEAERLKTAEHPTVTLRTPRNHVAHGIDLDIPLWTKTLECEGKIVVVLGRGGRYIKVDHALKHIFGYSIYNDGTAKGFLEHSSQFGIARMFDMSAAFGPWITTEDEFGEDPYGITIETKVNDEVIQSNVLSDIRHTIEETIAYISSAVTMFPGDVVVIGLPAGDGPKPERLQQIDDRVDITVSGIGTLSNVIKPEPTHPRVVGCC